MKSAYGHSVCAEDKRLLILGFDSKDREGSRVTRDGQHENISVGAKNCPSLQCAINSPSLFNTNDRTIFASTKLLRKSAKDFISR